MRLTRDRERAYRLWEYAFMGFGDTGHALTEMELRSRKLRGLHDELVRRLNEASERAAATQRQLSAISDHLEKPPTPRWAAEMRQLIEAAIPDAQQAHELHELQELEELLRQAGRMAGVLGQSLMNEATTHSPMGQALVRFSRAARA